MLANSHILCHHQKADNRSEMLVKGQKKCQDE